MIQSIAELLRHLRSLDVKLSFNGKLLNCSAPPGVLTPELKSELASRKEEIRSFLQREEEEAMKQTAAAEPAQCSADLSFSAREHSVDRTEIMPSTIIPTINRDGELPISFQQRRLWFLDQLAPKSAAYNIPRALRLIGPLNCDALERSLKEIVDRHEGLRTHFLNVEGSPKLTIHPARDWHMRMESRPHLPKSKRDDAIQRFARDEGTRPFDISHNFLLRASLLVLDDHEHVLMLVMHHIASDGWSLGILVRELSHLYPAFCVGRPSPLPKPKVQYVDYAAWQRKWLTDGVLTSQLPYWQKQLGNSLPVLELPTDRPRPPVQTSEGALSKFQISEEIFRKLKTLSRSTGATLYMTLLAVFSALLHRYGNGDDIIVGSAAANRSIPQLDDLIGFFINNLVIRTDLGGDPTARTLIGRVRDVVLSAQENQDVPFDYLVEILHPQRDLNHSPLFQVMFNVHNFPIVSLQLPDLTLKSVEIDIGVSAYDLIVEVVEDGGCLTFYFIYKTDVLDRVTVERMQAHFKMLLEGFVADPDARISDLSMLTVAEQHRLVREWNRTQTAYPADKCIHELFEEQVRRTPEASAVIFDGERLSYRQLNAKANRLARHLKKLGIVSDALVGICLERSLDMVVALLGVLKAGGAYVPLDPAFPRERLGFMMKDANIFSLLTQHKLLNTLPSPEVLRVICIDKLWDQIAGECGDDLGLSTQASNLAYVIYTSGSTGEPKGVQIEHHSVINFLTSMHREPGLTDRDRLLSVTTLSFDIAGLEIYGPLTVGGQVILASRTTALNPIALAQLIEESQATVMQATPATWRALLEAGWRGVSDLRIFCGGEALPRDLADKLLESGAEVWNLYGPTETTIWSTVAKVARGVEWPSIGRPIANTYVYLLDGRQRPVPVSVPGEIYIGGDGVARGYLNRSELTAERFVPDPFRDAPDSRMYRTGDLARFRDDGTVQCLGRIDNQVKVRGFRIELGEIEAALGAAMGVSQGVVVAREDGTGSQRLIAYLLAQPGSELNVRTLRAYLSKLLPEYMIPSIFLTLESFPLTPNGKVDRKALPSPGGEKLILSAEFVSPSTDMERVVAAVWQEVLKLEKVGLNDNFFDLGGHSLLVVQVQSRLRKRVNRKIQILDLFQRPTVASLAEFLTTDDGSEETFLSTRESLQSGRKHSEWKLQPNHQRS